MSMAQLVAAGAPELPEGWFYRVESAMWRGAIRVIIRRPKLIGSKEVERSVIFVHEHADELAAVVSGCRHAHRRWQEREESRVLADRAREYYGDHDPKGGR
ncbi:hypothetical protein ACFWMJ_23580 [Streptomyces hawaiiensis]|uniref:hypothetical protein n=1 Tax=Streptomyces hawaiiensis TaxID=67305 RepID=UPI00364C5998